MTGSLSETLAPPRMATKGRGGSPRARPSASSSASRRGPAAARGKRRAQASTEACARCAAPNASFTYSSPQAASAAANSGEFRVSPGWNRRFSSRTTSPGRSSGGSALGSPAGPDSKPTALPRSSWSRSETGRRLSAESGTPRGRPRWEVTTTAAPISRAVRIAGRAARRRLSSATRPFARGAFRSVRRSSRRPRSSRSASVSFRAVLGTGAEPYRRRGGMFRGPTRGFRFSVGRFAAGPDEEGTGCHSRTAHATVIGMPFPGGPASAGRQPLPAVAGGKVERVDASAERPERPVRKSGDLPGARTSHTLFVGKGLVLETQPPPYRLPSSG